MDCDDDSSSRSAIVIVARHGERLDYVTRDAGGNWCATAERPFDPPLTDHGKAQALQLGKHLAKETKRLSIPPISNIYCSPLLRCLQTAVAAGHGATATGTIPPVRVELGLVESINDSWYSSWALPGSNGTWGFRVPGMTRTDVVDPLTLHPLSKQPIQTLLNWKAIPKNESDAHRERSSTLSLLDLTYASRTLFDTPYCFHPRRLESGEDQRRRMVNVVETFSEPCKRSLLVSHGGPVTHLYEELMGNKWHVHGESTYCCYSIYRKVDSGKWETLAVNESTYLHEKLVTERHVSDVK